MWWYLLAEYPESVCIVNVGITAALVQNKLSSQYEQMTFVSLDVSRASSKTNHAISVIVAVENECNGAPEDMVLCQIPAERVEKWHSFVSMQKGSRPLSCSCVVYDFDSLATSNFSLKECKRPNELRDWMVAAEKNKRCRFVVCSFRPPMTSCDDSFFASFGWFQPIKSPRRLTIPWPRASVESIDVCLSPSHLWRQEPEYIIRKPRQGKVGERVLDFLKKNMIVCPADTLEIHPFATSFNFVYSDFQCATLYQNQNYLTDTVSWVMK